MLWRHYQMYCFSEDSDSAEKTGMLELKEVDDKFNKTDTIA